MPGAVDLDLPTLDANELAWLATLSDVESRLVFTERVGNKTHYRVEQGPFAESDLNALPDKDWTLLVQDIEKHLPDFRKYFRLCPFIPSWRFDDLMISFATPGGSVGPHKDNYDVFLCQGEGSRDWRISHDRSIPMDSSATSLSLLESFEPTEERLCTTGDVLYLPPGIPHWGIANTPCMTYSIGMRAPTKMEIAAAYSRVYSPARENSISDDAPAASIFYSDPDLRPEEALNGAIALESIQRMREQRLMDESCSDEELMTVLGSVVTDPKAWLDPEHATVDEMNEVLQGRQDFCVHGMALTAWCETSRFNLVFVNGLSRSIPGAALALVQELCTERFASRKTVQTLVARPEGLEFVSWLLAHGLPDFQ